MDLNVCGLPGMAAINDLLSLAVQYLGNCRYAEAEDAYRKVLAIKPDWAEVQNNLGYVLEAQGRLEEAAEQYKRATFLKPSYAEAHNNLGNILRRLGRINEAGKEFAQALALRPNVAEFHNNVGATLKDQGRLDEAAREFREALALKPDYAGAHSNLGNVLREQRKPEEAVRQHERALALRPDLAELHNNLGAALKDLGKLEEAAKKFEEALALRPDYADAHNNLGNVLREQGKLTQAAQELELALTLNPNFAEAHINLGSVLEDLGQVEAAAERYQRALALKPDYAEAHYKLGNVFTKQGNADEAMKEFERALALNPDFPEARNNLGNCLDDLGRLEEAAEQYQRALACKPDYADAHSNLGNVLGEQGKYEQSALHCARALVLDPNLPQAHNNMGNVMKILGKFDEATEHYDRALALKPDLAEAHYNRADLKRFRAGDADLAALRLLAADLERLPARHRPYIHFALAKALDDVGDYACAFEHLVEGNALQRRVVNYDEAAAAQLFRDVAQAFDARLFKQAGGSGDPSQVPIFILGMPRSGSTLVEQILASHPLVHAAGELNALELAASTVRDSVGRPVPYPRYVHRLDIEGFRRIGAAYVANLPSTDGGQERITDKMPSNFLYVGLIRLVLPNARIIHTVRDPMDTCFSCFSRLFTSGATYAFDLGELGRYYRRYSQLMAHWRSVLPSDAMLEVAYEEVVDNLEEQARRLIDYCGLPWDDRCLEFHRASRPVSTSSNVQVRQPLYRSSVQRWRRYEAYLQPLLAELQ